MKHNRIKNVKRKTKNKVQGLLFAVSWILFISVACILIYFINERDTQNNAPEMQESAFSDSAASEIVNKSGKPDIFNINPGEEWKLVLVNKDNPLPDGFKPELAHVWNGFYFDERAADALLELFNACEAQGLKPFICSSYRSIEKQTALYNNQVEKQKANGFSDEEALVEAAAVVMYPGKSEHNLGLAADIVSVDYQILDEKQEETEEQQWLMANCHRYGFILRYPKEKQEITGVTYEPWHYRYVGVEAATYMMENDICLEEFLELID